MKRILISLLLLALSACASDPKKPGSSPEEKKEVQQESKFNQGVRALDTQDYAEAARIFDSLLLQKPGAQLDLVTIFNSGSAYEGLGQCQKAADRFRQVVRASAGKFRRVESEALFHLSLMYECLGQDAKTVTSLLDARRRGKELIPETVSAEIPARLAAAYARLGSQAKSLDFFNQANQGLKSIVTQGTSKPQMDKIARTMYLMGRLSPSPRMGQVNSSTYLQSLNIQQTFLMQAAELNVQPFASKAEEDLRIGYDNIARLAPPNGPARREFLTRGLQTIAELKKIRLPKTDSSLNQFYAFVDKTELSLQNELNVGGVVTNPLTPESEQREGLKRQGRLVDPNAKTKKSTTDR